MAELNAYDCFHISRFHDFLDLFSFSGWVFFLYISCVVGSALWFLLNFVTYQKKKFYYLI